MKTLNEMNGLGIREQGARTLAKCTEACRTATRKLKQLEEQLTQRITAEIQGGVPQQLIQQAMNEAEALAWSTKFPLLFLPELAEEKILSVRQWANRQHQILEQQRAHVTVL
jgi:hypothetical protein